MGNFDAPSSGDQTTHWHNGHYGAQPDLSAQVFANPSEFLQVIKDDFSKIAKRDPNTIFQEDLVSYVQYGDDPRAKAAAQIALNHFPELQAMAPVACGTTAHIGDGLKMDDLNADIGLLKGDTSAPYWNILERDSIYGGSAAVTSILMGVGAVITAEAPPAAVLFGIGSLGNAALGVGAALDFTDKTGKLADRAAEDQTMVGSWLTEKNTPVPSNGRPIA